MEYLAHISEDKRKQTVLQHLEGTADLCRRFAASFGAEELGDLAGMAHDIGKYSAAFQRRLEGGARVDHATAGAFECFRRGQTAAAFCVAGHHGGLPDGGSRNNAPDLPTFWGRMNRARRGELEPYGAWQQELALPAPRPPAILIKEDAFFYIRMLYSCLVDADYLDTERFMAGEAPPRGSDTSMEALYERLRQAVSGWFPPKGEVNALRCAVLEQCIRQGAAQKPGLFTLTVPTGGGKTTASLAFALSHACAHGKMRIVYVIPYTSIIEQTARTFRDVLGAENVLEHHSNVQYDTDACGAVTPEAARRMRAAENWDMPVVVTTAVQFFESLYSNRPSQCRKLHSLANSVVIFDEAQMLPLSYLRPCVSAIAQLTAHYGVSAVLCTATQPALSPLFQEFLPGVSIPEICAASVMSAPVFKRVRFQREGVLTWAQLHQRLGDARQALCIVNSRKNALEVYKGIRGEGGYHLSTLMAPFHRRAVLDEIRSRLKAGLPCRVVSTSLIEAGVDVDFPLVFREEAGLDSILQAAGRCNREGKRPASESVVTVFKAETAPPEIFSAAIAAGQAAMSRYEDLSDPEAVSYYFHELLDLKGPEAQDKEGILPLIRKGGFPFRTVAEHFRLIDQDTRTVYIPTGDGAELVERLRRGERSRQLFRELGQYGVSVYPPHFKALDEGGVLEPLEDGSVILLDLQLYSDETGLGMETDEDRYFL